MCKKTWQSYDAGITFDVDFNLSGQINFTCPVPTQCVSNGQNVALNLR